MQGNQTGGKLDPWQWHKDSPLIFYSLTLESFLNFLEPQLLHYIWRRRIPTSQNGLKTKDKVSEAPGTVLIPQRVLGKFPSLLSLAPYSLSSHPVCSIQAPPLSLRLYEVVVKQVSAETSPMTVSPCRG